MHKPTKKYIELLPAALLPIKKEWQRISRELPSGTCLIILPDHNPRIERQMRMVAQVFEQRGHMVQVLREADLGRARS